MTKPHINRMDNLNFEPWKKTSGGVRINDIFKTKSGQIAQFPLCNMPAGNHGSYCMQKQKQKQKTKTKTRNSEEFTGSA